MRYGKRGVWPGGRAQGRPYAGDDEARLQRYPLYGCMVGAGRICGIFLQNFPCCIGKDNKKDNGSRMGGTGENKKGGLWHGADDFAETEDRE